MNDNYLHRKKNNLNLLYLIVSLALIIFGFYKNGILVYKEINNKLLLFKPLLFPLISVCISLIYGLIKDKKIVLSDNLIYMLVLSLCIPIKTSIVLFLVLDLIFSTLLEFVIPKIKIDINYVALFKIILIGVLYFTHKYTYQNELELLDKYSYNITNIFIGRGISGVCSSSILIIILSYILFCTNYYYKKEIPAVSISLYAVLALVFKFIFHKVIILNSLILFSLVFIAPLPKYSPAAIKERYIYASVLGILTFIFSYYLHDFDGVILAILLASPINYLNLK